MSTSISHGIKLAEERWLGLVRPQLASLFSTTFLPSHDQHHHQRVWEICKSLLREIEKYNVLPGEDLIEGLLLASWFHDAGMSIDPGEKHGSLGREIFEAFIAGTEEPEPPFYEDILEAIALHDSKDPLLYGQLKKGETPDILSLLSAADDLDALGCVGIYRYSEIYLTRGVSADQLGKLVLANVYKRFRNIRESFADFPGLMDDYLGKYLEIEAFFNRYNQALLLGPEVDPEQWGELGIISCIRDFSLEQKIRPEDISSQPGLEDMGNTLISYFKKLRNELIP